MNGCDCTSGSIIYRLDDFTRTRLWNLPFFCGPSIVFLGRDTVRFLMRCAINSCRGEWCENQINAFQDLVFYTLSQCPRPMLYDRSG